MEPNALSTASLYIPVTGESTSTARCPTAALNLICFKRCLGDDRVWALGFLDARHRVDNQGTEARYYVVGKFYYYCEKHTRHIHG